jgi:hypothetical protein
MRFVSTGLRPWVVAAEPDPVWRSAFKGGATSCGRSAGWRRWQRRVATAAALGGDGGSAGWRRRQRWVATVAALVDFQDEYRVLLDNLPASLESSRLAEKLQAITDLDLEELQSINPPRGYGRDSERRPHHPYHPAPWSNC